MARELVSTAAFPTCYIEGDAFWSLLLNKILDLCLGPFQLNHAVDDGRCLARRDYIKCPVTYDEFGVPRRRYGEIDPPWSRRLHQ